MTGVSEMSCDVDTARVSLKRFRIVDGNLASLTLFKVDTKSLQQCKVSIASYQYKCNIVRNRLLLT